MNDMHVQDRVGGAMDSEWAQCHITMKRRKRSVPKPNGTSAHRPEIYAVTEGIMGPGHSSLASGAVDEKQESEEPKSAPPRTLEGNFREHKHGTTSIQTPLTPVRAI